jgi:hypothetical protein
MGRRFAYVFNLFSRTVHALYTTQALSTIKTLRGGACETDEGGGVAHEGFHGAV